MGEENLAITRPQKAWLVCRTGAASGNRYLLPNGVTRIGRSPDNDIVAPGAVVSLYHAEISKEDSGIRIHDLGSTNGTYVDGVRIQSTELCGPATIRLGNEGPEFGLTMEDAPASELDSTLVIPEGVSLTPPAAPPPSGADHEAMLDSAVKEARRARVEGSGGETMRLMQDVINRVLRRSRRRSGAWIAALVAALLAISGYGYWRISSLKAEQASVDRQIRDIETRLVQAYADPVETDRLISQLMTYQTRVDALQHSLLYRLSARRNEDFVTQEIRTVMAEFGAEVYAIPPEFADRVRHYINQYRGSDRPLMERALGEYRGKIEVMRQVLLREKMPPELAYVPLVEGAFGASHTSEAGAVGPWQFTAATAKAFGLRVDGRVDERHDLRASTRAASRYLRELILDFGSGSSVMLALAAYNLGPGKVKQAIDQNVQDPIKQRNFWYLYRARALPAETREYVPRVFAAIVIGRNPGRFGFQ